MVWGAVVCTLLAFLFPGGNAQSVFAAHTDSRHKPGPVTIRGIASGISSRGFTLRTTQHGTYAVATTSATQIVEKGKGGHLSLHEGDHVGVHGFVQGRRMRAISVRIYPTKPKAYSVRGTLVAVHGSSLSISVSGKTLSVQLTSHTTIHIGSEPGSVRQLRVGDQVEARVQPSGHEIVALSLHVYQQKQAKKHVQLRGTVTAVTVGAITVRSGSTSYKVAVGQGTAVYLGASRSSIKSLKAGQTVTVYACCAGQPLTATSIHIRKTAMKHSSMLVRGRVVSLSGSELRIATSSGTVTVSLSSSTVYEVGSVRAGRTSVHVGDRVSIRVERSGSRWQAVRVHVYATVRRPRTVEGKVVSISRSGLVVTASGKRVTVSVTSGTAVTLNGKATGFSSIRTGDTVHITGTIGGDGRLTATRIVAKRTIPKAKLVSIRGTISQLSGSSLVITDAFGTRHQVRLAPGVHAQLHGKPAPAASLFPGVHAVARGHMSGNTLNATALTLSVTSRTVEGRVTRISHIRIILQDAKGSTLTVDVPRGVTATDGGHRAGPLHVGAYLRARGYVEQPGMVRAVTLQVLHPTLQLSATVVSTGQMITVETARGDRYRLRFSSATEISTQNEQLTLTPADIPRGARVRVQGTMRSDGTLAVSQVKVRLSTVTVQGSVSAIVGSVITVKAPDGSVRVRVGAYTVYAQGSHVLALGDIVVGDDVTIYGYGDGPGLVLARKVSVHRKLAGLAGQVASLTSDGFVLNAADGPHRVIISPATIFTGGSSADVKVGMSVHVAGYRRGDGVILATRVRLKAKRLRY